MRRMSSSAFRERSFATWLSRWRSWEGGRGAPPVEDLAREAGLDPETVRRALEALAAVTRLEL